MWISRKKWKLFNDRLSALEKAEQERKAKEEYVKTHSAQALVEAKKLLANKCLGFIV